MNQIIKSGQYLYTIAITSFGIIQVVTHNFLSALLPLPASFPARTFWAYLLGAVFIIAGVCLLIKKICRTAAIILGILFFLLVLYPHLLLLISNPRDPGEWTVFFETLSLCAGAFILAGKLAYDFYFNEQLNYPVNIFLTSARFLFAAALLVFGIQHFMYYDFILTLIPSWIPAQVFLGWIVMIAFVATSISIFLNIQVRLATTLSGIMFLLWVIFLHAPRVAANLHSEDEWTSLFVAMAMSGISFMLTSATFKKNSKL
jgi:uncharacterized membrane protein